jgi:TfoX/Sxy family transcriptional regulator of competence genes
VHPGRGCQTPSMAYDPELADRIRFFAEGESGLSEKRMFGGLAFLVNGNMAIAASNNGGLLARVDPARAAGLLAGHGVEPMEMRGRVMTGWLRVAAPSVASDDELEGWVRRCLTHAGSLPPKR